MTFTLIPIISHNNSASLAKKIFLKLQLYAIYQIADIRRISAIWCNLCKNVLIRTRKIKFSSIQFCIESLVLFVLILFNCPSYIGYLNWCYQFVIIILLSNTNILISYKNTILSLTQKFRIECPLILLQYFLNQKAQSCPITILTMLQLQ